MNILILGGTGFISGTLARTLLDGGHRVTIFTRGMREIPPALAGVRALTGDRTASGALEGAAFDSTFDAVYDMTAYSPEDSALSVRAFQGKVGRFIHCSTVSVYMVSNEVLCPVTEEQDKAPLMRFWDRNPFGMDYGIKKRACEDVLWHAHHEQMFPVSMIRPTFVSGPGDPARRDFFWIERLLDGKPILVPGSGDCAFHQVYIQDVAAAFAALLAAPGSVGHVYNVAAEEVFSLNEYLCALAALLGVSPEFVHVPQHIFDAQPLSMHPRGDVFPFNTRRTAFFQIDKARRELGYRPTPFRQWMSKTAEWWTNQDREHSIGYERRTEEVDLATRWREPRKSM